MNFLLIGDKEKAYICFITELLQIFTVIPLDSPFEFLKKLGPKLQTLS